MKRTLLALIRFYQRQVSPGRPPACRFAPTCSEYAYGAVELHGAFTGTAMAAWRILRCNPLNNGGYDPVPPNAAPSRGRRSPRRLFHVKR